MEGESTKVNMALVCLAWFARWYRPYGRRQADLWVLKLLGHLLISYLLSLALPSPPSPSIQVWLSHIHALIPAFGTVFFPPVIGEIESNEAGIGI